MSNLSELKAGLAIHLESLHKDAQDQPRLACDAGELAAEAKATARRAKVFLEETKAKVQREVRALPEKFSIDKVTEGAIASAVTANFDVKQAEQAAIGAQEAADATDSVANAYEHRRAMLKAEVEMWMNNYWGDVMVKERTMAPVAVDALAVKQSEFEQGQGKARRRRLDD